MRILVAEYRIFGRQLHAEGNIRELMALAERGHALTYIAARVPGSTRHTMSEPNFRFELLVLPRVKAIISELAFGGFVCFHLLKSKLRYDAVIVKDDVAIALFPLLLISRLLRGSQTVFLRVSTNPVETGGTLRTLALLFRYVMSIKLWNLFFDGLFFISPMLADSATTDLHVSREKVGVWPSCVDTSVFNPSLVEVRARRLRLDLGGKDRRLVLYHGDLSKARGIMEIVKAFRILRDEAVKVNLILLGDGSAKNEVLRYVNVNNLQGVVQLHGPTNYHNVPNYIAACDVEIVALPNHPWWRYQCPFKVLETLAMNKPLILSDLPCHRWIVGDAPVAVFLDGTKAAEIVRGINAFLANQEKLQPNRGRQIALNYSPPKIAEMLEDEIKLRSSLRT